MSIFIEKIMETRNNYFNSYVDINEIEKKYPLSTYSKEYLLDKIKQANTNNENNKILFENRIKTLQCEYKSIYEKGIADELLNSKVSAYQNILENNKYISDLELKALCNRVIEDKDVISSRYLQDYINKADRNVNVGALPVGAEEKIQAIDSICEKSISYLHKPLEYALFEKQLEHYQTILD